MEINNQKNLELEHNNALEHAIDEHFPKYKCKERSSALMLYASAILEHERIMCQVRNHLQFLLSNYDGKDELAYENALDFYKAITTSR